MRRESSNSLNCVFGDERVTSDLGEVRVLGSLLVCRVCLGGPHGRLVDFGVNILVMHGVCLTVARYGSTCCVGFDSTFERGGLLEENEKRGMLVIRNAASEAKDMN